MKKITTISPANIAFIKYWGRDDHKLFLPKNNNISMNMSGCITKTTVALEEDLKEDIVEIKFLGKDFVKLEKNSIKAKNIFDQINRIRKLSKLNSKVHVKSENNFPADAGIASSASGMSALTGALLLAFELEGKYEDKIEFSRQVRLCGSGSAIRSVYPGFVEMVYDKENKDAYAVQIADANHWGLIDVVAILDPEKKKISSSEGHEIADTSPYLETRITEMQNRIKETRQAILDKDLQKLGPLIEEDCVSMHLVMMTSNPPAFYWNAGTMDIIQDVRKWREEEGLQAYFTIDAGANVHIICEEKDLEKVEKHIKENRYVKWTIINKPCDGTVTSSDHLF
jgi:diphosphomevalonate decarboxylase